MEVRMAMMAMTTSSSIKVNALEYFSAVGLLLDLAG
jgi:hypothetical protein